ncbi:DNA binding protein, partial [Stereum hirsutum FP-91666 SS1]|uniref:DNA binding protein n=1 Tax=Stereum hirsutum (strain FP-91666) TaxID=721885 RepID=UPI000444A8A6
MSGAKTPLKSFDLSSFRYDPLRREAKGTNITATRTRFEREDGELDVNEGALAKLQSSQPTMVPVVSDPIIYPTSPSHRSTYLHPTTHKSLTTHQWAVYDLTLQIPIGKITTYKEVALALGSGSPRSVGSALRNNPFAPYVPCHRVVASNMFVGGFFGEWTDLKGKASNGRGK